MQDSIGFHRMFIGRPYKAAYDLPGLRCTKYAPKIGICISTWERADRSSWDTTLPRNHRFTCAKQTMILSNHEQKHISIDDYWLPRLKTMIGGEVIKMMLAKVYLDHPTSSMESHKPCTSCYPALRKLQAISCTAINSKNNHTNVSHV